MSPGEPRMHRQIDARVLFVHHRSELGGAPTSLAYLIRHLDRERFEPHVYCPPGSAAELFAESGAIVHVGAVAGFTHIWASVYRGRRWLLFARELARLPAHLVGLRRVLRQQRFALVHLNDSPLIPAAWLARRAGIPVIWHLRSALPYEGRDWRSRLLRAVIRRSGAASIAINDDVARVFDVGSVVIPNSADLERFRPGDPAAAKRELRLPDHLPVVSFFGFIYPSKGFREFIGAARVLRERGVNALFLIVGGAVRGDAFFRTPAGSALQSLDLARNYEREANGLVAELGLEDCIRFIPFTRDTATLYRASNVIVAPSRGPELGRPVIEGAASGVTVVATGSVTGGGIIVNGTTGVLVEHPEVQELAAAIAALLGDYELRRRIGRAAREHAEQRFDPARNARDVERVYARLLPSRSRIPILYIHHRPQLGGAPSSLDHLIRNLDPRFESHVLVPPGPAADLFERSGAIVHRGPVSIFAHVWDNPYAGLRWLVLGREAIALSSHLNQLARLMRKYRFPVVHLNDSPLLPAARVAHRYGARVVWHLRSALAGDGRDARSRVILELMERWGDAAIAIDRDVAERFRMRLPLTIVPNSVRLPHGEVDPIEAKRRLDLDPSRMTIGYAGFIRRQKGWPELVDAARILVDEGVPAHFVVMGGGVRPPSYFRTFRGRTLELVNVLSDEESAMKEHVRGLGLERAFSFLPFRADTSAVYPALDVVTFPNQGVGLGRPVLEAAAYGKPVVASGSVRGAGILIPDVTGILLAERSPEAIAAALRRLALEPETRRRMGEAAADHARRTFDPVRNARLVEDVYWSLLGGEAPTGQRGERRERELLSA